MLKATPISAERYAETFNYFAEHTSEYKQMLSTAVDILSESRKKQLKILSIGAGTGYFEKNIITRTLHIEFDLTCFEPNKNFLPQLWGNLGMLCHRLTVINDVFVSNTDLIEKYDFIIMSHVLYSMEDPVEIIEKAISVLNPGGKIIIFHMTEEGIYDFATQVFDQVEFSKTPIAWHDTSVEQLASELKEIGNNLID